MENYKVFLVTIGFKSSNVLMMRCKTFNMHKNALGAITTLEWELDQSNKEFNQVMKLDLDSIEYITSKAL